MSATSAAVRFLALGLILKVIAGPTTLQRGRECPAGEFYTELKHQLNMSYLI